jgi:hypothetical protein
MAITKKSLIGRTSSNNSAKNKNKTTPAAASSPVTPGKMVPAIRLAKAQLQTAKAGLQTTRIAL